MSADGEATPTDLAWCYDDLGLAPGASLLEVHTAFRARMWRARSGAPIDPVEPDGPSAARLVAAYVAILNARRPLERGPTGRRSAQAGRVFRGVTGFVLLGLACLLAALLFQGEPAVMLVVLALLFAAYWWWYRAERRRG